jgi:hypothetical protein
MSLSSDESRRERDAGTDEEDESEGDGIPAAAAAAAAVAVAGRWAPEILARRASASALVMRVPISTSQCTKYGCEKFFLIPNCWWWIS